MLGNWKDFEIDHDSSSMTLLPLHTYSALSPDCQYSGNEPILNVNMDLQWWGYPDDVVSGNHQQMQPGVHQWAIVDQGIEKFAVAYHLWSNQSRDIANKDGSKRGARALFDSTWVVSHTMYVLRDFASSVGWLRLIARGNAV